MVCTSDNTTATVTTTQTGTGWSVNVTALNLDSDLAIKDFRVVIDNVIQNLADYTKTSVTTIQYGGAALPTDTVLIFFRFTDVDRVYCPDFGDRLQSSAYNEEFDKIHKLINENRNALNLGSAFGRIVQASPTDMFPSTLIDKLGAGTNISFALLNPGGNEVLQITSIGGGGGGSSDLTAIGLITSDLPLLPQPTASTNAWVAAKGRDAVNDGGEGLFYWDEADITSTPDNGTIYLVQGGVGTGRWKRYRTDKTWWNVAWFGVIGDGVTDNYPALDRMRATIETFFNEQVNTIFFPPSSMSYDYSNNRWLRQLKHIRVDGYGVSLRNIESASPWAVDNYPVQVNGILIDNGGVRWDDLRDFKPTYAVTTTAVGEFTMTFVTPGDGSNFVAGEEVFLTGRLRQEGGYPPNLTYFELKVVDSVTANDITFKQETRYAYRQDWYSNTFQSGVSPDHTFGAAAIFKLDTATTIACRTCEFRGVNFLDNPNYLLGSKFTLRGAYWGKLIDCTFGNVLYIAETQDAEVTNCVIPELEIDKIIETCEITKSRLGGDGEETLVAATGVRRVFINKNYVNGRIRIMPIELAMIEDNSVTAITAINDAAIRADVSHTCLKFVAKNNTVRSPDLIPGTVVDPIGLFQSLTVDAISGNDIVLTDSAGARETAYEKLSEGTVIHNGDATNIGRVVRITGGAGTDITIEGTWENAPIVSEVYYWAPVQTAIVQNNTWEDEFNGLSAGDQATSAPLSFDGTFYPFQNEATKVITLTSDVWSFSRTNNITVRAVVERIEFEVYRVYSGAFGGTVDCEISRFATPTSPTPGGALRQRIDLRTLGIRSISANPWQCLGAPAGSADQIVLSEIGQYADRLQLRFREGAADLGANNHWELAGGVIRIYLRNPRASHTSIPINLSSASV